MQCPVCLRTFSNAAQIEAHIDRCLSSQTRGVLPPPPGLNPNQEEEGGVVGFVTCPLCNESHRASSIQDHVEDCENAEIITNERIPSVVTFVSSSSSSEEAQVIIDTSSSSSLTCTWCLKQTVSCVSQSVHSCDGCGHILCSPCVVKAITMMATMKEKREDRGGDGMRIPCPVEGCDMGFLSPHDVSQLCPPDLVATLMLKNGEGNDSIVSCPKCKYTFERVVVAVPQPLPLPIPKKSSSSQRVAVKAKGKNTKRARCEDGESNSQSQPSSQQQQQQQLVLVDGVQITRHASIHREQYRYRCKQCQEEFCSQCLATPYHLGYLCDEHQHRQHHTLCRYCGDLVVGGEEEGGGRCCDKHECKELHKRACLLIHPQCGHPCGGTAGETACLPCMHPSCGGGANQYCVICYVDEIGNAPSVRLRCGHVFHEHCIRKRLHGKWHTPHITFGYAKCPLCSEWVSHPVFDDEEMLRFAKRLHAMVTENRAQRRAVEVDITDDVVAERVLQYFLCSRCNLPYYGGRRECDQAQEDEDVKNMDRAALLCPTCVGGAQCGVTTCPKHGNQFVEFKCWYCCSVATYFCWGTTHFCTPCHNKASTLAALKTPQQRDAKLVKCTGMSTCPLGVSHPPHGEPFSLGCGLCRTMLLKKK